MRKCKNVWRLRGECAYTCMWRTTLARKHPTNTMMQKLTNKPTHIHAYIPLRYLPQMCRESTAHTAFDR